MVCIVQLWKFCCKHFCIGNHIIINDVIEGHGSEADKGAELLILEHTCNRSIDGQSRMFQDRE